MYRNGEACLDGETYSNHAASAAVQNVATGNRIGNEDLQAVAYAEATQQHGTPEDEHIKRILEHVRTHRDEIVRRQYSGNNANR